MASKEFILNLLEQEVEDFIQTQAEKVITFEDDPMAYILKKYPSLNDTLTDLMTKHFGDYVMGIYVMAPKPTTFKVLLHNGQFFYLMYAKDSYIAKIQGKKYYLLDLGAEEYATKAIADLLTMGKPPGAEGPDDQEDNITVTDTETTTDVDITDDGGGDEEDLSEAKEKDTETDDYGRPFVDPKGSRTYMDPDEMTPAARARKMMGEKNEKEFKPHMMYDPKTGEGKYAKVKDDHLKLKAKGWGHDKPKRVANEKKIRIVKEIKEEKKNSPLKFKILKEAEKGIRTIEELVKELEVVGIKDSYTINTIKNIYDQYSDTQKQQFNKYFRSLSLNQQNLDIIGDVYSDFYDAKASKGMGRGEVMVILGIKDSKSGGTAEKDILVNGQTYEVKELSAKEFSPAKDGDVNGTEYDVNFRLFKKYFTDSVLEAAEEVVTDEEFNLLKGVLEYTQANTTRNQKGSYVKAVKEASIILKKILSDLEQEDINYISVNGKRNIAISSNDAEKLIPGADLNITLGDELQDARKNINALKSHPWITNPGSNVTQLENILTKFFTGIDGLILFNYKGNKTDPYLITGQESRDMFFAGRVTQGIAQAKLK